MIISVCNQTESALLCFSPVENLGLAAQITVSPGSSGSLDITSKSVTLKSTGSDCEKPSSEFLVSVKISGRALWKYLPVECGCPWRVYCLRASKQHVRVLILRRRNLAAFLSDLPGDLPLSSMLLPGTHDTMAFYGWPISQCQTLQTPLATQLQSGIRVLDIRLSVINAQLIAYHGAYPQRRHFADILRDIHTFLISEQSLREVLVMSIKQEDGGKTPGSVFSELVRDEIDASPGGRGMWFLDNRIPRLDEVRGKVVMFSRFGGHGDGWPRRLEGMGVHPSQWPDSEKVGFSWDCKGTLVRTHDWYAIPSILSIPEKVALSTQVLVCPKDSPSPVLNISYFSASYFPLALPPTVSLGFGWPKWGLGVEGVNSRVGRWLLEILCDQDREGEKWDACEKIRGWTLMDFYAEPEDGIVPLLVECNFRR